MLSYLEGHRRSEYSPDLDFGTAIHAAVEAYIRRKEPISLEYAVVLFKKKWSWLTKKHADKYTSPLLVKDYAGLLGAGEAILRFVKSQPDLKDLEVVHNEFKLFESIDREDGLDIKFKGYIDIIFKGKDKRGNSILWVCDFKTCSWGWDLEKRQDRWRHFQLFLYKYYLCKKFNIDPKNVRTAFILLKKRPSKGADPVEWFPVSAGPVSVQRALDVLNSNITEMTERGKSRSFKKDRTKCREYGRPCPYLDTPLCTKDD